MREAAEAARAAPPGPDPPRAVDLLLDVFALRLTEGYASAAADLTLALERIVRLEVEADEDRHWLWFAGRPASPIIPLELWDFESCHALAGRQVQVARCMGALVQFQFAVNFLARVHLLTGQLSATRQLIDEDRLIAEATATRRSGMRR